MTLVKEEFFAVLTASGMPEIPQDFSVVPLAQLIPVTTLLEIDDFIRLFDRITTRTVWQKAVAESAPEIAQFPCSEMCFFTAWDFHLSAEQGWQLIECNDNGSNGTPHFHPIQLVRKNRSITTPASTFLQPEAELGPADK
jgi:hypothetical protein